ncbi:MAG: hypothetical protein OCU22_07835 [Canidatus Methanoxibalbensis ujae]|nr:hypothetical protein [Candidatus Methanoxibalbensis ujae]
MRGEEKCANTRKRKKQVTSHASAEEEQQEEEEIRPGFVVSEFHTLGREHASFLDAKVILTFYVPGVFDLAVKILLELRDQDGNQCCCDAWSD